MITNVMVPYSEYTSTIPQTDTEFSINGEGPQRDPNTL